MKKKTTAKSKAPRIDVHSHVIPKEMLEAIARNPERYEMRIEERDGKRRIVREGGNVFPVFREFYDADAKVAGMDRKGLDLSLISPAPMVFFYWLDADVALDVRVDDAGSHMCQAAGSVLEDPLSLTYALDRAAGVDPPRGGL